jgi:archaellum biogenesis ATPase FlaH
MLEHNNTLDNSNINDDKGKHLNDVKPVFDLGKYSIGVEDILSEAGQLIKQGNDANENIELFTVKTANRWIEQAKTRPIPKMLFDVFWHEGEICILFADTGAGKTILGVQIADGISTGKPIAGFKLEAQKQTVLYLDFELTDKQFELRYSIIFEQHYEWDDNFIRVEINPDAIIPENQSFEDYLIYSLECIIIETGAKVLFIDNLTYLKNDNEKAKDALPLMKLFKALKNKYGLSIMVLAHTPKRDMSKPINRNDLAGSKMLMNFCDSSFSIGESNIDKNLRYLKQIKERNTEKIYDAENVCVCQINQPHNFVLFELLRYGSEWEHLKQQTEKDRESVNEKVIELEQQGQSLRKIAAEMGISLGGVQRILKKAKQ